MRESGKTVSKVAFKHHLKTGGLRNYYGLIPKGIVLTKVCIKPYITLTQCEILGSYRGDYEDELTVF